MPSEEKRNPYTRVIDLTQRGQREKRRERAIEEMGGANEAFQPLSPTDLPESVAGALNAAGWQTLMPVQQMSIPYLLRREDVIIQSKTGSGKTGAFLLPLFELLDPQENAVQCLILSPTRELAGQIHAEFQRMKLATSRTHELRAGLLYGGVNYGPQIKALKDGVHVVVGTPGRILDHLKRKNFHMNDLRILILDEADEMLSMGFYPDMRELKRYLPKERASFMFSATMPPKVRSLSNEFLNDAKFITLTGGEEQVETLEYRYYVVEAMEKDRALVRLIEMENPDSAIIFVNTKREVEYLTAFLKNYGFNAGSISGDLSQKDRELAMARTRAGKIRFLVATDVAARGIDISDLSHVFMYDVPQDPEYLVHRSGRTARAGKTGVALVLTTIEDKADLLRAAQRFGIELELRPLPTDDDMSQRVAERMIIALENRFRERSNLERERLRHFVPLVRELAAEEPELLAMLVEDLHLQDAATPPEGQDAATPPEGQDAAMPPEGQDAATPPEGQDAATPPEGQDAATSPEGQDAATSPEEAPGVED